MTGSILEPAKRLPVRASYDVVVVGGGMAGVAAALAAAREGVRVVLLEKEFGVGGLATLGNVMEYLPLCDGMGHKVSAGLAESLLKLSVRDGSAATSPSGQEIPACWRRKASVQERAKQRYRTAFNPAAYAMDLERLLLRRGVELRYDTRFATVRKQGKRITHIVCEDKGGRFALACKAAVDASGDADVSIAAGEEVDCCEVNIGCGWFYYIDGQGKTSLDKFSRAYDFGSVTLPAGEACGHGTGDGAEVTAMVLHSNRLIEDRLRKLRQVYGKSDLQLLRPPSIASYRTTRRLRGVYELREADDRRWMDDAVGMVGHWRKKGPVYCLPLRSLYGACTANLITAGRCISAARDAWDVMRVIPACAVSGEAAGVAGAMLAATGAASFALLSVRALQQRLRRRGVLLDPHRLGEQSTMVDREGLEAEGLVVASARHRGRSR